MNVCPIEVVDYDSSLIAADWYEEQGLQDVADDIRNPNPCNSALAPHKKAWKKLSRCKASRHTTNVSICDSQSWRLWQYSVCNTNIASRFTSKCNHKMHRTKG